jgi:hypothetical protein
MRQPWSGVSPIVELFLGWFKGRLVEVAVDGVGHVGVGEGERVGVFPKGGRRVGVAEPGLGLEDLAPGHEKGGHVVPQRCNDAPGTPAVSRSRAKRWPSAPELILVRWS